MSTGAENLNNRWKQVVYWTCTVLSLVLGLALFRRVALAIFVLRNDELPWALFALLTPVLLIPLVLLSAFKPRLGGILLIVFSVLSAMSFMVMFNSLSPLQISIGLGFYLFIILIGIGFSRLLNFN